MLRLIMIGAGGFAPEAQMQNDQPRLQKNMRAGAFQPEHDLLKRLEGDALLAILQSKEA
jgi:hypothetical protein